MHKVDPRFAIALGASCALHAAAAAWLPGIAAQTPPAPPSSLSVALVPRLPEVQEPRRTRAATQRKPKRGPAPLVPPATSSAAPALAESSDPRPPQPAAPAVVAAAAPAVVAAVAPGPAAEPAPRIELPFFDVAYLDNPPPSYPASARRLKLQGTVVLRVLVDATGHAEELLVDRTSGASILDQAALGAVRGWRFVPARRGTEAIARWVDVPVRFRLQD